MPRNRPSSTKYGLLSPAVFCGAHCSGFTGLYHHHAPPPRYVDVVPTAEVDPGKAAELLAAAITIAAEQVLKQSQAPAMNGVSGILENLETTIVKSLRQPGL